MMSASSLATCGPKQQPWKDPKGSAQKVADTPWFPLKGRLKGVFLGDIGPYRADIGLCLRFKEWF